MHFVIIFIAVSVVLYVAVTPVYEYFKRKQIIARDEAIRKIDAEERRVKGIEASVKKAEKDARKVARGVQYPWSNLKDASLRQGFEIKGAVDKAFKKRMFMDTDIQKTQFKEATKKLMEDE